MNSKKSSIKSPQHRNCSPGKFHRERHAERFERPNRCFRRPQQILLRPGGRLFAPRGLLSPASTRGEFPFYYIMAGTFYLVMGLVLMVGP